ncbi:MAG: hypothetical protein IT447_02130 [Phycisphaerales bacterium]|jgi:predicted component of type VI protein secretion system|nr:hypothetical protein [Phycisphaerales bacterium]
MVSPNVNRILEQAQALTDAERKELRDLLAQRAVKNEELTKQQQVRQSLVQRGLVELDPPKGKDAQRDRLWQPIPIQGKPLSQTIIEERQ